MNIISSRLQARDATEKLSHKTALLGVCVARLNEQVAELQSRHGPLIEQLSSEIAALKVRIEDWARRNRKQEFGEQQSLEFPHGTLQFRKGGRSLGNLAGWSFKQSLDAMLEKASAWRRHIRVKKEINKQQILIDASANPKTGRAAVLSADKLRAVGLRVEQEEGFDVDLKEAA